LISGAFAIVVGVFVVIGVGKAAVGIGQRVETTIVVAALDLITVALAVLLLTRFSIRLYSASKPSEPVHQSWPHDLILAILFGVGAGIWAGISFADNPGARTAAAVIIGLPAATSFRLALSPWPRYAVAVRELARAGLLPRRPARFLDWAYTAGLVRMSGIAVQFRHRDLQDHLTT
jgi:hypothetical protein